MRITRAERLLGKASILMMAAGAFAMVWPQPFGGPTAFVGVDGTSMNSTYEDGDLIAVRRQISYEIGDVLTYRVPKGEVGEGAHVIHRIIGGDVTSGFVTQGDNRSRPDSWRPTAVDIVGASWLRVPGASEKFQQVGKPVPLGLLCGGLTVLVGLWPRKSKTAS